MLMNHYPRNLSALWRSLPLLATFLAAPWSYGQTSNNTCTAAMANRYPVNGTCVPVAFNKPAAYTATYNPGGCNAGNYDDAWGNFVATGGVTTVQYTPAGGDAILHVLASCAGPVLGCSNVAGGGGTETVTIETVPGTTYYVRVQRYLSNSAMNGSLCVFTSGDCLYTLHLFDTFGDGWTGYGGNAYVEVVVNGVSIGNWTLTTGYEGILDLQVFDGDVVQMTYHINGHTYYAENSFSLSAHGTDCLYASNHPPVDNHAVTVNVDCQNTPVPAIQQDCRGGVTICSDQSITSNSVTMGCFKDLSASNRGCLLSHEMQGSWYYFSPSASGTLGFTITPTNPTDDYDFALWGPYDAAQCPTGPPARCSYFDGNGVLNNQTNTVTGMGNGATDTSEGAYAPPASNNGWVQTMTVTAGKVYVLYVDNWSASGQAFDLDWNLSNGASLNCTTLPVELLALDATPRQRVIIVEWTTATERGAAYFEVERSADNVDFVPIGKVDAVGESLFPNSYRFADTSPLDGANYYRLRQVDRDGAYDHSHSVVAFMEGGVPRPALFPNPATEQLNIAFFAPRDGTAAVEVHDATGRILAVHEKGVQRGDQTIGVALDGLSTGWYSVRVLLPDGTPLQSTGFLKE